MLFVFAWVCLCCFFYLADDSNGSQGRPQPDSRASGPQPHGGNHHGNAALAPLRRQFADFLRFQIGKLISRRVWKVESNSNQKQKKKRWTGVGYRHLLGAEPGWMLPGTAQRLLVRTGRRVGQTVAGRLHPPHPRDPLRRRRTRFTQYHSSITLVDIIDIKFVLNSIQFAKI